MFGVKFWTPNGGHDTKEFASWREPCCDDPGYHFTGDFDVYFPDQIPRQMLCQIVPRIPTTGLHCSLLLRKTEGDLASRKGDLGTQKSDLAHFLSGGDVY